MYKANGALTDGNFIRNTSKHLPRIFVNVTYQHRFRDARNNLFRA